jgi:hypothetical protein
VQTRRWVNQSQPQTLVIATFLLYFVAFWAVLGNSTNLGVAVDGHKLGGSLFYGDFGLQVDRVSRLFMVVGSIGAGYLISNEKKIGYNLGLAVAALPLIADVLLIVRYQYFGMDLVALLFDIALFALLLHTQSRSYVRLWFK